MTDFWNTIDAAVSMLSAQSGQGLLSWTLARDMGSREYRVVVRNAKGPMNFPPAHPHPLAGWLSSMGLPPEQLGICATIAATECVADARWTPVHEPEFGWVRGAWRRPSTLAWQRDDVLSRIYWAAAAQGRGLPDHAWLPELKNDLSGPIDPSSRRRVLGAMGRLLSTYEGWEEKSGISLRAWAQADPAWQDVLDQAGLDYRARHEGVPLLVASLTKANQSPGWRRILRGAIDHQMETLLLPDERPADWWDEARLGPAPNVPLWCWAARHCSAQAWEDLIEMRPSLLVAVDQEGRSALHWAAAAGNEEAVKTLLNKGASPSLESHAGLMPEELVPAGKDALYEQIASLRLARPRHAV